MKKLFAFLLVISLVFMFFACSPKNDDHNDPSKKDPGTSEGGNKDNSFGDNNNPIDTPIVDIDPAE